MPTNVLLPQWGMNMEDGTLVKWLVEEGDTVEKGQALVEIETAKINSELATPVAGVVAYRMAPEGATVDVGTIVAVIGEPGETVARPETKRPQRPSRTSGPAAGPKASERGGARVQATPVARKLASQNNIDLDQLTGSGPNGRVTDDDVRAAIDARQSAGAGVAVQVVPRARRLAGEHDIDLSRVQGSGPGGRILVADVEMAVASQPSGAVTEVNPLKGLRRIIADRMLLSAQSMAPVTLTTEADVTDAVRYREGLLSKWRSHRIRPLDFDLIVKATAEALKEHPRLNSTLVNDEVRLMKEFNVGFAVAVPDGMIVPVLRQADERDLLSIAKTIRELADKARKGSLSIDEVTGATFTITSLSSYEIDAFTPIINPPEVAILGIGRIAERPAVHQGEIAVRSMMALSLTFDHRALDGVPAGEFLRTLKGKLEDPSWLEADAQVRED